MSLCGGVLYSMYVFSCIEMMKMWQGRTGVIQDVLNILIDGLDITMIRCNVTSWPAFSLYLACVVNLSHEHKKCHGKTSLINHVTFLTA